MPRLPTSSTEDASIGPMTRRIAAFAAAHRYEHLPPRAVAYAKETVLDTMGVMLLGAGPGYGGVAAAAELTRREGGVPECTVVARDFRAPVLAAALVNGITGYSADAEGGWAAGNHVAAVVVPAVLTVAEYTHASGKELIAALALGYEFMCRTARACSTGGHYPHSFHPSAVFGHFGAAGAAGHLLRLSERQYVNALGLAGINATGLVAWVDDPTEDSRGFVIGAAAQGGVRAAMLAQLGMGGPLRILDDAKYSIYAAFSGGMYLDRLVEGLGEDYWLAKAFGAKVHTCCGDIMSGVDALLALCARHALEPDDIESMTHWVRPGREKIIDDNPLKSHNAQYVLSVAAVRGKVTPDFILTDQRADPRVARLYRHVRLLPEPAFAAQPTGIPAAVEVVTRDGRRLREEVRHAKGFPENPLSDDEIRRKFLDWSTTRISRGQAERIIDLTDRLEEVDDAAELVGLLAADPAGYGARLPPPGG